MSDDDKKKPSGKTNLKGNEENKENRENSENEGNTETANAKNTKTEDSHPDTDKENVAKTTQNAPISQKSGESAGQSDMNATDLPRRSALYVLHTEKGNVSVNRRCHLPRSEGVNVKARRKLIVASILCLIFTFCEIAGGVISNSLSVAADAAHTLTDFAGFMISLFAIWLAGRKATDRLSFGWYRAEVIGALMSVMTIWFVTAILVWMAINRFISRKFDIDAIAMMITAAFGIVTNIILGIYLWYGTSTTEVNCESNDNLQAKRHTTNHSHGHTGIWGKLKGKCFKKLKRKRDTVDSNSSAGSAQTNQYRKTENINVKAAYLHVLGDGLQSVSVFLAAVVIYLQPSWVLADPICTFLFSAVILYTTFNILKDIIVVLMEGTPTYMDYNAVQATIEAIPGIKSIHHLRIWALSLDKTALAVHLVIESGYDPHEILLKAEETIHTHYNLFETTIQIEEEGHQRPTLIN